MNRSFLALALIVVHVLNPALGAARESMPTFEERIADMEAEAARFLSEKCASDHTLAAGARVRVTLLNLPPGSEIAIQLQDGKRVPGKLRDVGAEKFALLVDVDAEGNANAALSDRSRGTHVTRTFRFEDVESIDLSRTSWMGPEALERMEAGKRVEVLLLDGSKVQGRLKSRTAAGFTLELGGKATHDYPFEQVAMARKSGMTTSTKAWIGVGVAATFGVMLWMAAHAFDDLECRGNCSLL